MKSVFLSNIHYAFAQTDGDMLKQAKKEIETLEQEIEKLQDQIEFLYQEMAGEDL